VVPLLAGETVVLAVSNVIDEGADMLGVLVATEYRLRFFPGSLYIAMSAAAASATWPRPSGAADRAPSPATPGDATSVALQPARPRSPFDLPCEPAGVLTSEPVGADAIALATSAALDLQAAAAAAATAAMAVAAGSAGSGTPSSSLGTPPTAATSTTTSYLRNPFMSLPLLSISRMEVLGGPRGALVLRTTDERTAALSFARADCDAVTAVDKLAPHVWLAAPAFPLRYRLPPPKPSAGAGVDGWRLFSFDAELRRMAAHSPPLYGFAYRLSSVNDGYTLCPTYPSRLILPTAVTDPAAAAAAKFRSKRRLPAIVWFCGTVSLARASQPLTGLLATRSPADEALLAAFGTDAADRATQVAGSAAPSSLALSIMDARPRMNALGNAAKGGGTEAAHNYAHTEVAFLGIDNIHVVRDALRALKTRLLAQLSRARRARTVNALLSKPTLALEQVASGSDAAGSPAAPSPLPAAAAATPDGGVRQRRRRGSDGEGDGELASGSSFAEVSSADLAAAAAAARAAGGSGSGSATPTGRVPATAGAPSVVATGDVAPLLAAVDAALDAMWDAASSAAGGEALVDADGVDAEALDDESVDGDSGGAAAGVAAADAAGLQRERSTSTDDGVGTVASEDDGGEALADGAVGGSVVGLRTTSAGATTGGGGGSGGSRGKGLFGNTTSALKRLASRAPDAFKFGAGRSGSAAAPAGREAEGGGTVAARGGVRSMAAALPSSGGSGAAASTSPADDGVHPWLRLISILLSGGARVAGRLAAGVSVFVHCSDGWDRTAGLTSIAQLLLDPYYRSLPGFCILVEKEWCSFGHRFARRCGTGGCGYDRTAHKDDQRAPIFAQWVDAVWQVWRQHPAAFEFNERLLAALAEHAYAGRFGTFLFDCERDRVAAALPDAAVSLWTYVLHPAHRTTFTNAAYVGSGSGGGGGATTKFRLGASLLTINAAPDAMAVWPYWLAKWASS